MTEAMLLKEYRQLPEELKIAVSSYFELLTKNYQKFREQKLKSAKIRFGTLKGKITVPKDFDEPLEDFNDYMY